MREDEQQVLGLSVESLLISNMTDRRARRQMETPQIKHVLGTADQQLELVCLQENAKRFYFFALNGC